MSMSAQLGIVVDGILVSYFIDADAMASVQSCIPITQVAAACIILISFGTVQKVSTLSGAGNRGGANQIFSIAVFFAVIVGSLITALLFASSEKVANLLAPTAELSFFCNVYLSVLLWRFPVSIMPVLLCDLVRADGMDKLSSKTIVIQQCTNVSMDTILMGIFNLGLFGAAVATILGDIAGMIFILKTYLKVKERTFKFIGILNEGLKKVFEVICSLCRTGMPAALGMGLLAGQFWCIYQIFGLSGGTDGVKIYAACMLYLTFLSMFSNGLNQSMLPILGVLYGEKDYKSVRMLIVYARNFLMKIIGVSVIVAIIFPQELLTIFKKMFSQAIE